MKRYYLVHDDDMPKLEDCHHGTHHWIELNSHGPAGENWNLMVLESPHGECGHNWIAFPPIFDSKTTLAASNVPEHVLADIGLTGAETCIEAVMRFGEINPALSL
ncbi:hypothetical protein ACQKOE_07695 [Novosphingobium sp. NPDC080210]|uniref:hypothetical protein n=1 Tax=Novosphingobium sp. NPDC080210 TaxID=3390596 RepID=UPI003D070E99